MNIADDASEPLLRISGFALWVHNRQFPNADDFWDGNWLNVTAKVEANNARVRTGGSILHLSEVEAFASELVVLIKEISGTATLGGSLEPNLSVSLRGSKLGHVTATVAITPDHMSQSHKFTFEMDQTFLGPILASCQEILRRFPIRDKPAG